MKKVLLVLIVPGAFVLAMLLGSRARFQSHVSATVEKIQKPVSGQSSVNFTTNSGKLNGTKAASPEQANVTSPEHGNGDLKILHTRELVRLKQYERVTLQSAQRESFKKVFLDIAMNPKSDWLTQRQALRNLYLQKVELSQAEADKLMATVDQRAMATLKSSDAELLREVVTAL